MQRLSSKISCSFVEAMLAKSLGKGVKICPDKALKKGQRYFRQADIPCMQMLPPALEGSQILFVPFFSILWKTTFFLFLHESVLHPFFSVSRGQSRRRSWKQLPINCCLKFPVRVGCPHAFSSFSEAAV